MHIPPFENTNKPLVDVDDSIVPLTYFNIVAHVQLVAPAAADVRQRRLLEAVAQHAVGAAVIFTILVDQYHHFAIPVRADHLHLEQVVGRLLGERVVARHVDVESPLRQRLLGARRAQ